MVDGILEAARQCVPQLVLGDCLFRKLRRWATVIVVVAGLGRDAAIGQAPAPAAAPGAAPAQAPGAAVPAPGASGAPAPGTPAQAPGAPAPAAPGRQPGSQTPAPTPPSGTPVGLPAQTTPAGATGQPTTPVNATNTPAQNAAQQPGAGAQTWQQIQDRFRLSNPTLQAGVLGIDEARAQEITAHLRPNPTLYMGLDQLTLFHAQPYRPLTNAYPNTTLNYLHERDRKRELRTESAEAATRIATTNQADLLRTLGYTLRQAFVQVLQSKAILALTKENLAFYDEVLRVSRDRFQAGDIAEVDLNRLELGRVQYESDFESADIGLRTSKIQLLQLINDRTPVDRFDVVGPFEYKDALEPLPVYEQAALAGRSDLLAALQAVEKARVDHRLAEANGSTDPTFGIDFAHQPDPLNTYMGVSMNIPLRIFDRNQGEKRRTLLDIDLNERRVDAARAQVFADVDAAYATVESQLRLLRPYKGRYLDLAVSVRDTIAFSYQHGGASLLDFLQAQQDYRGVELGYLQLVGQYLAAASGLNQSIGREVLQ